MGWGRLPLGGKDQRFPCILSGVGGTVAPLGQLPTTPYPHWTFEKWLPTQSDFQGCRGAQATLSHA